LKKIILFGFLKTKNKFLIQIKNIIGYYPNDVFLFKKAMIHKSVVNDGKDVYGESNERLELLGDAVLGMIVMEYLYVKFPHKNEGELTQYRSKIVSRNTLNKIAITIGLNELIVANIDKNNPADSLYGNAFEALVGAIYLDLGIKKTEKFLINKIFKEAINLNELLSAESNFKSKVIEWAQKEKHKIDFKTIEAYTERRIKTFSAHLYLNGEKVSEGTAKSKKKAEQIASKFFCKLQQI
jgi:ribonuclease-3